MSQPPPEPAPTPLQRSWIPAAWLLVGIASYAGVFINALFPQGREDQWDSMLVNGLVLGVAAILTGLMVFVPASPPARALRVAVYAVPIGLLLLVQLPTGSVEFMAALLLPWALLTALYGVKGGLPAGWGYTAAYPAAGVAACLLIATVWFNELVWLMPLLPVALLLRRRYRGSRLRMGMEVLLAVLLAACIAAEFVILPQGESWLPYRSIVGTACTISVFYTVILLGLARLAGPKATSPAETG